MSAIPRVAPRVSRNSESCSKNDLVPPRALFSRENGVFTTLLKYAHVCCRRPKSRRVQHCLRNPSPDLRPRTGRSSGPIGVRVFIQHWARVLAPSWGEHGSPQHQGLIKKSVFHVDRSFFPVSSHLANQRVHAYVLHICLETHRER